MDCEPIMNPTKPCEASLGHHPSWTHNSVSAYAVSPRNSLSDIGAGSSFDIILPKNCSPRTPRNEFVFFSPLIYYPPQNSKVPSFTLFALHLHQSRRDTYTPSSKPKFRAKSRHRCPMGALVPSTVFLTRKLPCTFPPGSPESWHPRCHGV